METGKLGNKDMKEILEELRKLIEQDTLWEMTNLRKFETGLPVNVSIQLQPDNMKKYRYNIPRLRFQNNTSDRVTSYNDLIPTSIEDNPHVLIDKRYDTKLFKCVKEWIILNKDILLQHWNQDIDSYEFIQQMQKLNEDK